MDEVQFAIPREWYKMKTFESEEEAKEFINENNLPTGAHFSDKLNKYYVDNEKILTNTLLKSVDDVINILSLKVQLKIDSTCGNTWADCH